MGKYIERRKYDIVRAHTQSINTHTLRLNDGDQFVNLN